ncbi:MAG: ABC transporter ATP-binding protein [Phycisphaerales bacterium]|nr:ABC transporter ATP-binding protein [Phycisphaerales bacterium]
MSIAAHELSFRYPRSQYAIDGVSCEIKSGRVTAIVGPNGSGKSTLIRLLSGLRSPELGSVLIDDQLIGSFSHVHRARLLAFIEQRPQLAFDFAVRRVIEFGAHHRGCSHDQIEDAINRFELSEVSDRPYAKLSVGQQQRVSLARAWVQIGSNPKGYLLADEPCSAMDPKFVNLTMTNLRSLADSGVGVGIVIHDLTSAARWADDAIVLNNDGRLAGYGEAQKFLNSSTLSDVFDINIRRFESDDGHSVLYPTCSTE